MRQPPYDVILVDVASRVNLGRSSGQMGLQGAQFSGLNQYPPPEGAQGPSTGDDLMLLPVHEVYPLLSPVG
jgi:hypothetical protein